MQGNRPRHSVPSIASIGTVLVVTWVVALGLTGLGCREDAGIPIDTNLAPETVITGAPGDSQTSFYRVRVFWNGSDRDGDVVGFEWAITDSIPDGEVLEQRLRENYTTRSDSTFIFPVEANREVLASRFYVRAIDNDGKRDPTPAFTFFAARNTCAPEVTFTQSEAISPTGERMQITSTDPRTPTDTIPAGWSVSFCWEGFDCDIALLEDGSLDTVGSIDHYLYHLSPLELSDIGGTIADSCAVYPASQLRSDASYTMFVRAVDDAQFAGLDPAVRTFIWNKDPISRWQRYLFEGDTDSSAVFYADTVDGEIPFEEWVPFTSGDTLPMRAREGIKVQGRLTGWDPDDPTGRNEVVRYQARLVTNTGFWTDLPVEDPVFRNSESQRIYTENSSSGWKLQGRTQDRLGRWDGSPETIVFFVNKAARFVQEAEIFGVEFTQMPPTGGVVQIEPGALEIPVRILAIDPDPFRANRNLVNYRYKLDQYIDLNGNQRTETFFGDGVIQSSPGSVNLTTGIWTGTIGLANGNPFQPGPHVLEVEATEYRSNATEENLGVREVRYTIPFTVEYE